jgi:hypothetical protein
LQTVADHVDDPADHPQVVYPFNAVATRKIWLYAVELFSRQVKYFAHGGTSATNESLFRQTVNP